MTDAPTPHDNPALDATRMAALVHGLGYKALVDEDGTGIESAAQGLKFSVQLYANRTVQFYLAIKIQQGNFLPHEVNQFNRSFRFAKTYIVERSDGGFSAFLESDMFFDVEADDAAAQIERCYEIWNLSLNSFVDFLRKAEARAQEAATTDAVADAPA